MPGSLFIKVPFLPDLPCDLQKARCLWQGLDGDEAGCSAGTTVFPLSLPISRYWVSGQLHTKSLSRGRCCTTVHSTSAKAGLIIGIAKIQGMGFGWGYMMHIWLDWLDKTSKQSSPTCTWACCFMKSRSSPLWQGLRIHKFCSGILTCSVQIELNVWAGFSSGLCLICLQGPDPSLLKCLMHLLPSLLPCPCYVNSSALDDADFDERFIGPWHIFWQCGGIRVEDPSVQAHSPSICSDDPQEHTAL